METKNPHWRKLQKTLISKIQYLLSSAIYADVILSVTDGKTQKDYEAHSIFLKIASPVFEKMLDGDWNEKLHKIDIQDVDPEIFGLFLRFLYYDDVELKTYEEAADLLKVAHRFLVDPLVEKCATFMSSDLTPSNAVHAHSIGDFYQVDQLKEKVREIMVERTHEMVSSEEFAQAHENLVSSILEEEVLNISEFKLFKSVEGWLNKRADKRNLIDALVPKFRFFSMSVEEFSRGPSLSDLLTSDQKLAIILNMVNEISTLPLPQGFTKSLRSPAILPIFNLRRYLNMTNQDIRVSQTILSVDQPVTIEGFEVSNCWCMKVEMKYKIKIFYETYAYSLYPICVSKGHKYKDPNSDRMESVKIKMDNPLTLIPGNDYRIYCSFNHECHYKAALLDTHHFHHNGINFHIRKRNSFQMHYYCPIQSICFSK